MLLRKARKRAWSTAVLVLVSFLSTTASQAIGGHGVGEHDLECAPAVELSHDESAHRLSGPAAGESNHPLHCLVCHWARSFRPSPDSVRHNAPILEAHAAVHLDPVHAPRAIDSAQLALRAPPAIVLL
jgi:hypothetical protein